MRGRGSGPARLPRTCFGTPVEREGHTIIPVARVSFGYGMGFGGGAGGKESVSGFDAAPVYIITETGPDHAKEFSASVLIGGVTHGQGQGRSKKLAEQAAAAEACMVLRARRTDQGGQPTR